MLAADAFEPHGWAGRENFGKTFGSNPLINQLVRQLEVNDENGDRQNPCTCLITW